MKKDEDITLADIGYYSPSFEDIIGGGWNNGKFTICKAANPDNVYIAIRALSNCGWIKMEKMELVHQNNETVLYKYEVLDREAISLYFKWRML